MNLPPGADLNLVPSSYTGFHQHQLAWPKFREDGSRSLKHQEGTTGENCSLATFNVNVPRPTCTINAANLYEPLKRLACHCKCLKRVFWGGMPKAKPHFWQCMYTTASLQDSTCTYFSKQMPTTCPESHVKKLQASFGLGQKKRKRRGTSFQFKANLLLCTTANICRRRTRVMLWGKEGMKKKMKDENSIYLPPIATAFADVRTGEFIHTLGSILRLRIVC